LPAHVVVLAPFIAVRRIDELEVEAFVRQRVVGKGDAIHGTHLREGFLQQIRLRFPRYWGGWFGGARGGTAQAGIRRHRWVWCCPQGVFGDDSVFTFAEQEADGGLVVREFDLGIHGAEVETEFADVLGLEGAGFEFDHDVAAEFQVIEEEIDEEIVASHFKRNLTTDEGEAGSEFDKEVGDVLDEGGFDGAFLGLFTEPEKIEAVGILERLPGEVGLGLGQQHLEVGDSFALAFQPLGFDVDVQDVA